MNKSADEYFNEGFRHFESEKFKEAIISFTKAIKLKSDDAEAYFYRGISYYKLGKYEKAIADYDKAIRLKPDYAGAYSGRGFSYAELREHEKAIADYDKAIELNPDDAEAYSNRGLSYFKLGKYEEAIADYDKAIELNPDDAEAYSNRGNSYYSLGKYEEAITDYNKTVQLRHNDVDAYYNRGLGYYNLRKYEEAIADFTKVIKLKPNDAEAYNNRGSSYAKLGKYKKAIVDFTKAIEFKFGFAGAYNNRGIIYGEIGEYEEAIDDFTKALDNGIFKEYFLKETWLVHEFRSIQKEYPSLNKEILELLLQLQYKVRKYQNKIAVKDDPGEYKKYSHYTKLSVLKKLLGENGKEPSNFRLCLASETNDPKEGSFLIDKKEEIRFFYPEDYEKEDSFDSFIACFAKEYVSEDEKEDEESKEEVLNSLNLWRHYGKGEDGKDAGGVKIVLPLKNIIAGVNGLKDVFQSIKIKIKKDLIESEIEGVINLAILIYNTDDFFYEVKYGHKGINRFLSFSAPDQKKNISYLLNVLCCLVMRRMNLDQKKISCLLNDLKKKIEENNERGEAIKHLVRYILDEVRYIFKSGYYKEEDEFRIILNIPKKGELLELLKEKKEIIEGKDGRKYIKIKKLEFLFNKESEIFLGPAMEKKKDKKSCIESRLSVLREKESEKESCTVRISKIPFRNLSEAKLKKEQKTQRES